jgi:hypothetical protein
MNIQDLEAFRKAIQILLIVFVVILVSFYLSERYRVSSFLKRYKQYENFMALSSYDSDYDKPLCDFYVATCFRPYTAFNQMFDYISPRIIERNLRYGARCLSLDIYSNYNEPIVSVGRKVGNWKLSLNPLSFDDVMKTICTTAFEPGMVNNYDDPLILVLNINFQMDYKLLQKMKKSIVKHGQTRLLDVSYSYSQKNLALEPIRNLMEKMVILCNGEYRNSSLEEVVNGSIRTINNESVDPNKRFTNYPKEDIDTLKDTNKSNLSLIVPEERSFFTRQINPNPGWDAGCQFVAMYYQKIDGNMDFHMNKFRNRSFVLKPKELLSEQKAFIPSFSLEANNTLSAEEQKQPILSNCSTELK